MLEGKREWSKKTLRSVVATYIGGGWGAECQTEDCPAPAAVIRGTDIPGALLGNTREIPRRFHKNSNLKSRTLQPGDIIFEVSGGSRDQPVGRALYCSHRLLASIGDKVIPASFCKRIVPDSAWIDGRFLYYFLKSLYEDRRIAQWQVQSTGISNFQFEAFLDECEINLPPIGTQRRIASFLSAYDDLIENNTRRIAILEEKARSIYEEWFVRFRFPGYEQARMVKSELGMIPEGWTVEAVYDIAEVTYGFPFKSNLFRGIGDGRRGVIRIRDIKGNCPSATTEEKADAKYLVSCGDILVGMDGQFHMGKWAGPQAWLNQRVLRLRPIANISRNFLFLAVRDPIQILEKTIVGTTVAHLSAADMKAMRLVVPATELMKKAMALLDPMFDLELSLHRASANLRTTRDFLLPRLISGELDVSTLPEPEEAIAA